MGTNFENPHGKNWDLRVKMCFTPKQLFPGETDFTATYLEVRQNKKFFGYACI